MCDVVLQLTNPSAPFTGSVFYSLALRGKQGFMTLNEFHTNIVEYSRSIYYESHGTRLSFFMQISKKQVRIFKRQMRFHKPRNYN